MLAHVLANIGPHRQQHALTLVLAGPVFVRTSEVTRSDGSIDSTHDLPERDVMGRTGEDVATAYTPLGSHEAGPFESEEYLLEIGLGKPRPLGDVPHRGGPMSIGVQGQRQQGAARVVTAGRDLHIPMLSVGDPGQRLVGQRWAPRQWPISVQCRR